MKKNLNKWKYFSVSCDDEKNINLQIKNRWFTNFQIKCGKANLHNIEIKPILMIINVISRSTWISVCLVRTNMLIWEYFFDYYANLIIHIFSIYLFTLEFWEFLYIYIYTLIPFSFYSVSLCIITDESIIVAFYKIIS